MKGSYGIKKFYGGAGRGYGGEGRICQEFTPISSAHLIFFFS